ncbi:putative nuclease HARBI1 [Tanacetum coccineum]
MLHNLSASGKCREVIRISMNAFRTLCDILVRHGGLRPTQRMSVEGHVARFLHIVGNDLRNRFASWIYRHSMSTTSRSMHRVLRAIISLEDRAIDGTHVRVRVPNKDAARYRGRKGYPTINVLAVCTFDLKFTLVLTGWEGTASNSRIIKNALTRDDKLLIPEGRYYLVDAGLPHRSIDVRYHLKEYSTRAPQNARELFNLRHSSL